MPLVTGLGFQSGLGDTPGLPRVPRKFGSSASDSGFTVKATGRQPRKCPGEPPAASAAGQTDRQTDVQSQLTARWWTAREHQPSSTALLVPLPHPTPQKKQTNTLTHPKNPQPNQTNQPKPTNKQKNKPPKQLFWARMFSSPGPTLGRPGPGSSPPQQAFAG